jgi:peptidyl-tRNA hydrolase
MWLSLVESQTTGSLQCSASLDSQPTRQTTSDPITHYIIVRSDLSRGVLAAQVTHAAGESANDRVKPGTYAVVLGATADQLAELELQLAAVGVRFSAIRESDPPHQGELLALGIEPQRKSLVRRHVSSLPLLR